MCSSDLINAGSLFADGGSISISAPLTTIAGGALQANDGSINLFGTSTTITAGTLQATHGTLRIGDANTTTTAISGGDLQANGGTLALSGSTSVSVSGANLSATTTTNANDSINRGSITIQGGSVSIGGTTARTILRAGDAANPTGAESSAASLTLLDGGTAWSDGSSNLTISGGTGKTVSITARPTTTRTTSCLSPSCLGSPVIYGGSTLTIANSPEANGTYTNPTYLESQRAGTPNLSLFNKGTNEVVELSAAEVSNLGYHAGDELIFSIQSADGTFFTGDPSRNPDLLAHAKVSGAPFSYRTDFEIGRAHV